MDTYWGGENDITAAMAWEEDGETTIFFRLTELYLMFKLRIKYKLRIKVQA